MADAIAPELRQRLREAEGDELLRLVREHAAEIDVPEARQILLNPFVTREVIERLLAVRKLLTAYEVRRDLAAHRHTPEPYALRFLAGLYWRDLMDVGLDTRVRPSVRRAADRQLAARLAGLSAGEKINIARRGGPGVLAELRHSPDPRVMKALLANPRLTEGTLMPVVRRETTSPEVLETIAEDRRWGARYELRRDLASNPRTPLQIALRLLPLLKKKDLRQVASGVRVPAAVRRRARLLLGEGR